jgi:hypothetical protein
VRAPLLVLLGAVLGLVALALVTLLGVLLIQPVAELLSPIL